MRRVLLAAALLLATPASASAGWTVTGKTTLPPQYWQGVAFDVSGTSWFAGPVVGLYRDDAAGREVARVDTATIAGEPFNHIGDLEFDTREGGRLLLPLECYSPGQTPSNTCGVGAVGVADPATFARRYTVTLDGVPKTMWLALGPDGRLFTQVGHDLWWFSADAIVAGGPTAIDPAGSLPGVFADEADGAAVLAGRLYFTRQESAGVQQLWSLDLETGGRRLEASVHAVGESEGLAAFRGLGGQLHWVVAPGLSPDATYGRQSVLLHLNPEGARVPGERQRLSRLRLKLRRSGTKVTVRGSARVVGRTVPAEGAVVRAGKRRVTLDAAGVGRLHAHPGAKLTARLRGFRAASVRVR